MAKLEKLWLRDTSQGSPELLHSSFGRALTGLVSFIVQLVEHCEKKRCTSKWQCSVLLHSSAGTEKIDKPGLLHSSVARALRGKQCPGWQCSDSLHSSVEKPGVLHSSIGGALRAQMFLVVQWMEHWQVNVVVGGHIQICFIVQLVEHWQGRFPS